MDIGGCSHRCLVCALNGNSGRECRSAHGAEGVVRRIAILATDLFSFGLMVGGVVFIIGVALGVFQDGPVR